MQAYDAIVVGLGAMGSASVYQLASRGARVLGIDQFSPPHTLGSTHGDTRITRQAIGEGLAYVPLAIRSHEIWREVEAATGMDLLTTNGGLLLGRPGNETAHHGKPGFLGTTIAAARAFEIPHEVLDVDAIHERFPQFSLVGDETGYFEPGAGFLRPEACITAQQSLATQRGASIHVGERLESYVSNAQGVTVTTNQDTYSAATLVLSLGAWIPPHLPGSVRECIAVHRQVLHWFATSPPLDALGPEQFPVFIWEVTGAKSFYGFPAIDGVGGGMKMATEQYSETTDPDHVTREVSEDESLDLFDALAGARFAHLERRVVRAVSCLYTTTRDGDFIIDWHPDVDHVLLISPCSGHGFKHSAAIGEVVAELATEGRSSIDIESFALRRFEGTAP